MECPEEGRGHVKGIKRLGKVTVCKDGDPSGLEMLVLSYFPAFIPCVCFFCSLCFEYSSSFFLSLQCYFLCILPAFSFSSSFFSSLRSFRREFPEPLLETSFLWMPIALTVNLSCSTWFPVNTVRAQLSYIATNMGPISRTGSLFIFSKCVFKERKRRG